MTHDKPRTIVRLESVANIAIVLLCVAAAWSFLRPMPVPPQAQPGAAPTRTEGYRVGDSVAVSEVVFDRAAATLLLVVQSSCQYCTKSMPFYRTLSTELRTLRTAPQGVRFIVVSPEPRPITQAYLDMNSLTVDEVVQAKPGELKIGGTPTAMLVGPDGRVKHIWKGWQDEERQGEMRRTLVQFIANAANAAPGGAGAEARR